MAHDVFISYSSKDKPVADAVCAGLEAARVRCWIAPRDVLPGEDWPTAIVEAIKSSRVMVLIFSARATLSTDVVNELVLAMRSRVAVIPFRIDDSPLEGVWEYYLSRTHWLDAMNPPTESQIQSLVERTQLLVRGPGRAVPPMTTPVEGEGSASPSLAEGERLVSPPPTLAKVTTASGSVSASSTSGRALDREKIARRAMMGAPLLVLLALGIWLLWGIAMRERGTGENLSPTATVAAAVEPTGVPVVAPATPTSTATLAPTTTPVQPTATAIPPTETEVPSPTAVPTRRPTTVPTSTPLPPTETPTPPTATPVPPTETPGPPTATAPPTAAPVLAPPAPTGVQAAATDARTVRVSWGASAGNVTSYSVTSGLGVTVSLPGNVTTYTWGDLSPQTNVCFRVRAEGPAGASDWSTAACATTPAPPPSLPAPPSNVVVQPLGPLTYVITWKDNSNNEDGFTVVRWGPDRATVGPNVTEYKWEQTWYPGNQMCFTVESFNSAGSSSSSRACTTVPLN